MYIIIYDWANIHFQTIIFICIIGMIMLTVLSMIKGSMRIVWVLIVFIAFIYILALVYVTLGARTQSKNYVYNIEPLWTYYDIIINKKYYLLWEDVANAMMFLPLGMFLRNFFGKRIHWYGSAVIGLLLSMAIELIQLVTKRGFCDIDDLIHNTIGVLIGYFLTLGIQIMVKKWRTILKK